VGVVVNGVKGPVQRPGVAADAIVPRTSFVAITM